MIFWSEIQVYLILILWIIVRLTIVYLASFCNCSTCVWKNYVFFNCWVLSSIYFSYIIVVHSIANIVHNCSIPQHCYFIVYLTYRWYKECTKVFYYVGKMLHLINFYFMYFKTIILIHTSLKCFWWIEPSFLEQYSLLLIISFVLMYAFW